MNDSNQNAETTDPLEYALRMTTDATDDTAGNDASDGLLELAALSSEAGDLSTGKFLLLLGGLARWLEVSGAAEADTAVEIRKDLCDGLHRCRRHADGRDAQDRTISDLLQELASRWTEVLRPIAESIGATYGEWDFLATEENHLDELDATDGAANERELILASLASAPGHINGTAAPVGIESAPDRSTAHDAERSSVQQSTPGASAADTSHASLVAAVQREAATIDLDEEIKEAYLDDARRGLAEIESALMQFEERTDTQQLQQVCRELHTLKGASASVGLQCFATFIHRLEEELQDALSAPDGLDVENIFGCVDVLKGQIQQLSASSDSLAAASVGAATQGGASPVGPSATSPPSFVDVGPSGPDCVRVKSAQLDRLTDMLAELIMLRNRRESRVDQLKEINGELLQCVSRLRAYDEATGNQGAGHASGQDGSRSVMAHRSVSSLTEIANDLLELGRCLRDLYEPVSDENLAISRFIRQFRAELTQLRRVPVTGLFQRLQRAIRDAARKEGKQVRVRCIGEEVGLNRSVQEQLYEPLLHVVRNAVSHGIEDETLRERQGKDPVGTITLEAQGAANMLVVTVRDDGQGLNYDALRRKGVQKGLIPTGRVPSRAELAQLIFHPGFSTRDEASDVSGRGVGMDIVAATLQRLHSWVEVDSEPGHGTNIRMMIPLQSIIEHVMVFQVGGRPLALPTHLVQTAGPLDEQNSQLPLVSVSRLLGLNDAPSIRRQVLVLSAAGASGARPLGGGANDAGGIDSTPQQVALLVDEIVGPEEVVVRPLPAMLQSHRLFGGVTLAGSGDVMLLLDGPHLLQRALSATLPEEERSRPWADSQAEQAVPRALVVDDSRSSRKTIVQMLRRRGYECVEASDGAEAQRLIRDQEFAILFTDLEMPNVNGLELVRAIRRNTDLNDLPIVMVSSRDELETQEKAKELGVDSYVVKPMRDETIESVLKTTLMAASH